MGGVWIRSQNKKQLSYCRGLHIGHKPNYSIVATEKGPYTIEGVIDHGYTPILGFYATEERASQILDTIQKHIEMCIWGDANGVEQKHAFEMPEE